MPDVTMPRLSDSMEEGTILKWLKSDGDEVKRGEELAEIETDKATLTYEADADGVLEIVAKEGDTLPIGEVIAKLGDGSGGGGDDDETKDEGGDEEQEEEEPSAEEDEGSQEEDEEEPEDEETEKKDDEEKEPEGEEEQPESGGDEAEEPKAEPKQKQKQEPSSGGEDNGRVKASPVARRLAEDQGVDLATLEGSGPGGRIVKADVEKAAESGGGGKAAEPEQAEEEQTGKEQDEAPEEQEAEPSVAAASSAKQAARSEPDVAERGTAKGDVRIEELSRVQQVVARRMAEAKATIPDFTLTTEVDMERAVELRRQFKKVAGEDGVVPSYNDMVVKAAAMALRAFPRANGAYKDNRFELYSRVNIGVAVAAQDSLVVPTVFDADQKSMGEIARDMRRLAARVRDGTVGPPELSGGTFTVSNLGMYGVTEFTAVINPPQAAILAVGALVQEPRVSDGKVVPRHVMRMTIVSDHRILYGADAAQFLAKIRELLEEPLTLAL